MRPHRILRSLLLGHVSNVAIPAEILRRTLSTSTSVRLNPYYPVDILTRLADASMGEIETRCVNIVARLFNAPLHDQDSEALGVSSIGSREAIIPACLAAKRKWQNNRLEGKSVEKPNKGCHERMSGILLCSGRSINDRLLKHNEKGSRRPHPRVRPTPTASSILLN